MFCRPHKNLQKLTDITFVSKQQNLMKSPWFDRMSIQVHIPENFEVWYCCLFSKEYDPSNTTIILGFLNKVNVFLACSKIERYGHFWPRRHQNFPISQLWTQPKFLHKEVKIPTWGRVLAWRKLVMAGPGIRVQGTPHLTPHPESVQPTCRLLTSTRWVDSPTFPYALSIGYKERGTKSHSRASVRLFIFEISMSK